MDRQNVCNSIFEGKIIAIVRGVNKDKLVQLGEALNAGGINMMEITFNLKEPDSFADTAKGIEELCRALGGKMTIGAGTVTTPALAQMAHSAGAKYIISPDFNISTIQKTRELGMVSIPGALSPTEIRTAFDAGADFVKVFPAATLGARYIKEVKGPLSHIPLLAVGGINEENIKEFFDAGAVGVGIGGFLINKKWIAEGEFEKITELASRISDKVR